MRIALFRDGPLLPPRDGATYSIHGLITALAKTGMEVFLFRCFRGWDDPVLYKKEPFTTIFLREKDFYCKTGLAKRLLKKFRISIVQFDSPEIMLRNKILKEDNFAFVWEVHGVDSYLLKTLGNSRSTIDNIRAIEREALKTSDVVLCRSRVDRDQLAAVYPKARSKMHIIRGCIDPSKLLIIKPDLGSRNVLLLGNFYYQPNVRMVKLASKIHKRLRTHGIRFLLLGDAPDSLVRKLSAEGFEFLGFKKDLNKIFRKCALAISPLDRGSGTRLKILDFLAGGLPVIATSKAVEGLEKIEKVVVIEDKLERYPQKILELFENRKRLNNLSKNGKHFVNKEYNWSNQIQRVIKAYGSLD